MSDSFDLNISVKAPALLPRSRGAGTYEHEEPRRGHHGGHDGKGGGLGCVTRWAAVRTWSATAR
jgi:hypothetical protein